MANLLVKEISSELLREVNYAASGVGLTQREWVLKVLMEAVEHGVSRDAKAIAGEVSKRKAGVQERGAQLRERSLEKGTDVGGATSDRATGVVMQQVRKDSTTPAGRPDGDGHPTKTCRIYRCGQCAALGVKDKNRGLV